MTTPPKITPPKITFTPLPPAAWEALKAAVRRIARTVRSWVERIREHLRRLAPALRRAAFYAEARIEAERLAGRALRTSYRHRLLSRRRRAHRR